MKNGLITLPAGIWRVSNADAKAVQAMAGEPRLDFFRLTQIRKNSENRPYGGNGKNRLGRFRFLPCLSEGIRNFFADRSHCP
jgi:hypothetical protein